jgi:hypothetical protein
LHKTLLEISPEAKDRLPKRQPKVVAKPAAKEAPAKETKGKESDAKLRAA